MKSERLNSVFHYSLFTIRLNPSKHLRHTDSLGGLAALYRACKGIGRIIMGIGAHTEVTRKVTSKLREALFPVQRHFNQLLHRSRSGKNPCGLVLILMKWIKARQSVACVPRTLLEVTDKEVAAVVALDMTALYLVLLQHISQGCFRNFHRVFGIEYIGNIVAVLRFLIK